jgi:LPS sulfotransferase NodH
MICAAPRTGSTLLAQALRDTGRAGRPSEFFDIHEHNERFWINSLGITSDAQYFDKVLAAASTENGIFGQKLHWHQAPALLAKLRAPPALADAPDYVRGISIRTEPAREHQTKLTLGEFADKRRSKPRP